jgi:Ser/Thr protein kinase RdoA (MazF antagonist)
MRQEANLPVQEPIPTLDGKYLLSIQVAGVTGERNCSLLRWIKGRSVKIPYGTHHFKALGQLLAQMHAFSAQWKPPSNHFKRLFDWNGLFQNDVGSGMTNADAWAFLCDRHREAFSSVASRLKVVMNEWGQGPDCFGLIHGDLGLDANLLFWHGQPRAIDFDDSGFGYWIFDLAVAVESVKDDPRYALYKQALLEGYSEYRYIPQLQVDQLELFLCALEVYWNLWATGGTHLYPEYLPLYQERMATSAEYVVRTVETSFY